MGVIIQIAVLYSLLAYHKILWEHANIFFYYLKIGEE